MMRFHDSVHSSDGDRPAFAVLRDPALHARYHFADLHEVNADAENTELFYRLRHFIRPFIATFRCAMRLFSTRGFCLFFAALRENNSKCRFSGASLSTPKVKFETCELIC